MQFVAYDSEEIRFHKPDRDEWKKPGIKGFPPYNYIYLKYKNSVTNLWRLKSK